MTNLIILAIIILLIPFLIEEQKKQAAYKAVLSPNSIDVREFKYKKEILKNQGYDTEGVYVFTNVSKNNLRYVGQSVDIVNRVSTHLSGRGNKEVYRDIKQGNQVVVEFIKLYDTNFHDLNSLERFLITKYDSYYNGYNKTRGNA